MTAETEAGPGRKTKAAPAATVNVRVLKKGAGQISTGQHVGGVGEATYDAGALLAMDAEAAAALEDRGWVEIR